MACKQPPVEMKIRDCTSFLHFKEKNRECVTYFHSNNCNWRERGKDEVSKILRPLLVKMMTIWKEFVHDLLKETVEAVFGHATTTPIERQQATNSQPLLQTLLKRALLSYSSYSVPESCNGSDPKQKLKLEIGATVMSKHLFSDPSILNSYEQELLGKCDQVTPIFSGDDGIDFVFNNIFQISKPLSVVILESGPVKYNFISYKKYSETLACSKIKDEHSLTTVEILNDMLCLYHGACCVFSDQHPEVFDKLDGELFDSPNKDNFQKVFGEIPGDFLHILHKYVKENKKEAYIYPLTLTNFNRFINALADALCKAISTVVLDKFGIQIW